MIVNLLKKHIYYFLKNRIVFSSLRNLTAFWCTMNSFSRLTLLNMIALLRCYAALLMYIHKIITYLDKTYG